VTKAKHLDRGPAVLWSRCWIRRYHPKRRPYGIEGETLRNYSLAVRLTALCQFIAYYTKEGKVVAVASYVLLLFSLNKFLTCISELMQHATRPCG
jgi:tetrahydromethanopterin S-methyltransferase subunit C